MTARLCFDCTNNIAKYEVYTIGIRATIEFKIQNMKIFSDYALVIH